MSLYKKEGRPLRGAALAPVFYDIATDHKTPRVKRLLARRKCDRFEMHANFTWKWQLVDVALAVNLFYKIIAQIHNAYVYFGGSVQE